MNQTNQQSFSADSWAEKGYALSQEALQLAPQCRFSSFRSRSARSPWADLRLLDGNPSENIRLIEDPAKNFLVVMKNGKIYKNTVN
jgi:hypothetical protein